MKNVAVDIRQVWLLILAVALAGCQSANPIAAADTNEQRAYASYGTFVIFQEKAADLAQDATLPRGVRLRVAQAEQRARPVAESLLTTYMEFIEIKAEFDAGDPTAEARLVTVSNNLNNWVNRLAPLVNELVRNVKGAED